MLNVSLQSITDESAFHTKSSSVLENRDIKYCILQKWGLLYYIINDNYKKKQEK